MTGKKHKRIKASDASFNMINHLVFLLLTLICVYPFYYMIINTVSANDLSANGYINFWPRAVHFDNYVQVLSLDGLSTAALVSLGRTVMGTICTVFASAFLGFMFTQENMWHRKFWYRFFVITMYFNAGLIPMFVTMQTLHLTNTFWVYVIPAIVQPFNIILVKTYVESMPKSLQEAAEIDGAGIFTVFGKIILPTAKPILATVAIFSAVGQWNSFQDTLIYITEQKLYSLQYLLYNYLNESQRLADQIKNTSNLSSIENAMETISPKGVRMTITVLASLPIFMVYPFMQKYFVKGIMVGAVKG